MWCTSGLETLINVTENERQIIVATLKDEPIVHNNPMQMMILRARFNSQRHYEIYIFDSELAEQEILDLFEFTPQVIVDAIRRVGHELYSDRAPSDTVIV
jgi:hypothetical protein